LLVELVTLENELGLGLVLGYRVVLGLLVALGLVLHDTTPV